MGIRFFPKYRLLMVVALALTLALVGCSPFGRGAKETSASTAESTATALPTHTPMPAIDLSTPTPTTAPATPTPTAAATSTPLPTATAAPAHTPGAIAATPQPNQAASTGIVPASASGAEVVDAIQNGSFEDGFDEDGVANGWTAFTTQEGAVYAWEDETHDANVSHGEHAQLMRIMGPSKPNQFIGLYQQFAVVPGETYTLTLHGLIRTSTAVDDFDPLAFRLQWALDDSGGADWTAVEWQDWVELGWTDVKLDAKWPEMNAYVIPITPQGDKATLFVRGWSKWPLFQSEAKFYVDGIFVRGPAAENEDAQAPAKEQAALPTTGRSESGWIPVAGLLLIVGLAYWEVRKNWAQ
jgi:LPXTG-motif cell wall-anchored protein